jgi:hypothetical protein
MTTWPQFDNDGDLPVGLYQSTLELVIDHFGLSTPERRIMARRLARIYQLGQKHGAFGSIRYLRFICDV